MITAQKASLTHLADVDVRGMDIDQLLTKEWLLTNSRGSFSSGTVLGCNTRRYHSLLTGTVNPPANRTLGLANFQELIKDEKEQFELTHIEFAGALTGSGIHYQESFYKDYGVHFEFDLDFARLTKSVYLLPDMDVAAIVYSFKDVEKIFEFSLRPFAALRDFHSLINNCNRVKINFTWQGAGLLVERADLPGTELFMRCDEMWFDEDPHWWHNFYYRKESQRQQDCTESLFSPGIFKREINGPCQIVFWASIGDEALRDEVAELDFDIVRSDLDLRQRETAKLSNHHKNQELRVLYSAAQQFVIEREIAKKSTNSILAGYPWFLDWGRDTFIALPGLLLDTGKFEQAYSVLETFASAVDKGMIPNRFDDYGGKPHYNSIDASLWFVDAAFKYHNATLDTNRFENAIMPHIKDVIQAYQNGTRFGIHCDVDGLLMGGSEETQLTWMDAKNNGDVFTPRFGKAVETNALWYNILCNAAEFYREHVKNQQLEQLYSSMAQTVEENFTSVFWDDKFGWLADCILPDGTKDLSMRPNQIFAVSLPFSPLSRMKQQQVLKAVERDLLTPYGLRSLSPVDPRYKGRYLGNQYQRDSAYHQGTVWAFLMGPYIEAMLRVNDFSGASKKHARELLIPLLGHLMHDGCIGSVSEIFDGDPPFTPRGCFAQAWSVAALLHAYTISGS